MNTARLLPCGTLTSAPNVWFERLAEICLQLVIYLCARMAIIDQREKRVSHNTINSVGGVEKNEKKEKKKTGICMGSGMNSGMDQLPRPRQLTPQPSLHGLEISHDWVNRSQPDQFLSITRMK